MDIAEKSKTEPVDPKALTPQNPKVRIYSLMAESYLEESKSYSIYGDILMAFDDSKDAIEKYEKAIELPFTPVETYINLGKCLMELGQYDDAVEHLKKGRNYAAHDVVRTKEGIEYQSNAELIKEAEKLITEIEKKRKINSEFSEKI